MKDLPPPPKGLRGLVRWCDQAWQAINENRISRGPGVLVRRGSRGTSITALGGDDGGGAGLLQFNGQWADGSYSPNDIVICEAVPDEMDDGYEDGTFIASEAVVAGDLHPGLQPQTATLAITVNDGTGHVTAITVTDGGEGYAAAPAIAITGPGGSSGATAHGVLTGTRLTSVVVDTPGTGYTQVGTTATAGAPTKTQKWEDFSLGAGEKKTMRPHAQARNRQVIVFDSGRDPGTLPSILLRKDRGDGTVGEISVDIAALLAVAPAGHMQMKPRLWDVCVGGEAKQAVFLSTDAF